MRSRSYRTAARLAVLAAAYFSVAPFAVAADPPLPLPLRPAAYTPPSPVAAMRAAPIVPLSATQHGPGGHTPAVPGEPAAQGAAAPTVPSQSLGLADLEQLALRHNPTLAQAAAFIDSARGKAVQAGLPLNPTVGIKGEQIGADRKAGEWSWFYLQQEIVTGGKLRLSRLKYEQEAYAAEVQACAQRLRVANAIAEGYFHVLAAQRSVENHKRLKANAEDGLKTTEQLLNVGQANEPDLLQAKVEVQRAAVALKAAETRLRRDWEQLTAVVGVPTLPLQPLAGPLEPDGPALGKDEHLARLLEESPELAMARIEVKRDQIQLERERREPIPNVTVRGGTGYNFETRNNTAEVGVSVRLPLFDRNQGTVRQAQADLTRATAEVSRVELDLRRRFADAFSRYETARDEVESWKAETLPTAQRAYELYLKSFKDRRAAWPQVLVAQRTVYQLNEDYNRSLVELRRAEVEVRGLLLTGGLTAPRDPTPAGHINSVPKPR
jgi:cobalt-zinc-cadmium efflux system outer membrane protein